MSDPARQLDFEITGIGDRGDSARPQRRLHGAYYTSVGVAEFMADWAVRPGDTSVLEPSFGDGRFLKAVERTAVSKRLRCFAATGIEIDPSVVQSARSALGLYYELKCQDFMTQYPFPVNSVIGNPPYVRLRHLKPEQRHAALSVANRSLEGGMDPSGSLWMPFVLHATKFLIPGGRLAFVLPYELTYVRYARSLWAYLAKSFGSIQVLRTHERLFPELLQDVVVLLADDFGGKTDVVAYRLFERVRDLLADKPAGEKHVGLEDISNGERPFVSALLDDDLRLLLRSKIETATVAAREVVSFNIGYVTGDKEFFHPSTSTIDAYGVADSNLHPAVSSARSLRGAGLFSSGIAEEHLSKLFRPDPGHIDDGAKHYIMAGASAGVPYRYKCRVRDPWFVTPNVRAPDVLLTVFSEKPLLVVNNEKLVASNSLLCGYTRGSSAEELATKWYSSLTLLSLELQVHALGGGVMVLIPGEVGNVRLPVMKGIQPKVSRLDRFLRRGDIDSAYRVGDDALVKGLGFTASEIDLIRQGAEVLAHWRTSARTSLVSRS